MGRGRSSAGGGASRGKSGGGGGGGTPKQPAQPQTPSGVSYQQFMAMSMDERYDTVERIVNDRNLKVPSGVDNTPTSRLIYGLGMENKPTVVDDSALDALSGKEIYRTVYEQGTMPPPSTGDVTEMIRYSDYTQMSGSGGSFHGRAIYFATDFTDSTSYGSGEDNPMVMRGKLNSNATIRSEQSLLRQMNRDVEWQRRTSYMGDDAISVYALSHGVDGWFDGTYTMMVNRGAITFSSQNRRISTPNSRRISSADAMSWQEAAIVQ